MGALGQPPAQLAVLTRGRRLDVPHEAKTVHDHVAFAGAGGGRRAVRRNMINTDGALGFVEHIRSTAAVPADDGRDHVQIGMSERVDPHVIECRGSASGDVADRIR
jgi:hypothetical protein